MSAGDSFEKFIQKVTREAGAAVLERFGKEKVHYVKSGYLWDVVTKADLLSQKIITSRIRKKYPDHGIISEEQGPIKEDAEYIWVIDPIDGTLNFSRGVPLFGVMVCLVHKGRVILSAVHLPATDEFFFARAGGGAYCNGKRIRCTSTKLLTRSFGASSSSLRLRTKKFMTNLLGSADEEHMMLAAFGSIAVNSCYVAAGRRDWFVQASGKIWDFAPAYLMLKESGCNVTDMKGKPWQFGTLEMVAANPRLHKELLKLTRGI
jgi:myo-inositol-1(or 4)-monophosphatase